MTRDQPNSREKMRDFTVEFLKCIKFHTDNSRKELQKFTLQDTNEYSSNILAFHQKVEVSACLKIADMAELVLGLGPGLQNPHKSCW